MSADAQGARIEPLLPDRTSKRGGRWRDHRQVIDAIAFKYPGTPWTDLPEHFGSWKGGFGMPSPPTRPRCQQPRVRLGWNFSSSPAHGGHL
ncbi:transposase [Streptomyces sp. NPDC058657]|uniref:transposase n=1 Tax=unclassified Streptomyces TaxID=2593676 RepID=UPI00366A4BF1